MKTLPALVVAGMLLLSASGHTAEPATPKKQLTQHQLHVAEERSAAISDLLNRGYAAPIELEIARTRVFELQRQLVKEDVSHLTPRQPIDLSSRPSRMLIRLPGFSTFSG